MALTWPSKDPNEVLDYEIDWTTRLAGDTILTSTWTISQDAVLVKSSDTFSSSTTTIWLQSGTLGKVYKVTNRVTTAGSRIEYETVYLAIATRS